MKKFRPFSLLLVMLLCTTMAMAQTRDISGRVTDQTGNPVTGVTISIEENQSVAAVSDINGEYVIKFKQGETLVFNFVGYAVERIKPLSSQSTIDIVLKEKAEAIDEVVVVGYGTSKRKDITGAVSSVSAEKLTKTPALSLNSALQGKSAGVRVSLGDNSPGGGVSVQIRGLNSISQSNAPIYVVDGVIMQGTLNNINVNDIASIDILKDASSAAIYGSRAANGVVLVTTKRGTQGKGVIRFDAKTTVQSASNLPRMLNAQELAEIRIEGNVNAELNAAYRANPNMDINEYRTQFNDRKSRYMTELPMSMFSATEKSTLQKGESYNWADEIMQQGIIQDYTLSFSGASDKTNYYLSFNYYDHQGLVVDSKFKRLAFRVNLEQKVKDWLKVGLNSTFSNSKTVSGGSNIGQGLGANPLIPFFNENGDRPLDLPFFTAEGQHNPVLNRAIKNDYIQNRFSANFYAQVNFLPEFNFKTNISTDIVQDFFGKFVPSTIKAGLSDKGQATIRNQNWVDLMWDNTFNYTKVFAEKHNFGAMLGSTLQTNDYHGNQQYGTGFATNVLGYNSIGGASKFPSASQWSNKIRWQIASFMARVNYGYDDRYLLTVTGRFDGNSKYGVNNKWGFFPAVAGAWRLSNESWLKDFDKLDDLKIRVGWGELGNSNLGSYASFTKMVPGITVGPDGKPINTIQNTDQTMGNPMLRWERQQQINAGVDLTMFENRLRVAVELYQSNSKDLVLLTPMPVTTGYLNMYSNVGEMSNRGLEITVGGTLIETKDFSWNMDVNWSTNKNELTKLYGGLDKRIRDAGNPTNAGWWVGQPLGTIYTYKYDGIWQWGDDRQLMDKMKDGVIGGDLYYPGENKLRDLDGDGKITGEDREIVGYTDPKWYGGFSTNLAYKGFSLDLNFNYVYGNMIYNRSYHEYTLGAGYGFQNMTSDQLDRWTVDNQSGSVPRANSNNLDRMLQSSRLMQDGSFLRLKAATLAYDFPQAWMQKIKLNSLRLYVSGENLLTWTNYKGADPESPGSGYDETYPNARGVSFGLSISF